MEQRPDCREPLFDTFDLSIGDYTGEELRRICAEAIVRGKAYERARREIWRRRLKSAIFAIILAIAALALLLAR